MNHAETSLLGRMWHTRLRDLLRGRFDARLDWRRAVQSADLPADLREAIADVVGRSRLWRSEKVEVASELIAHFEDGLNAGRSPAELLKSFGDSRQAAELIRRAKKRGRPLAWHVCRYCLWTLAILVVAYVGLGIWMLKDSPSITTDYLALINQPAITVPETERAWPLYREALLDMGMRQATQELTLQSEEMHDVGMGVKEPSAILSAFAELISTDLKPGDATWPEAEKFLNDHADSISELRQAANRRNLGFVTSTSHAAFSDRDRELFGMSVTPKQIEAAKSQTIQDRSLISTLIPHLHYLRYAAALLLADARRATLEGDGAEAWADVAALFGLSRHCEEPPFLVCLVHAEVVQKQAHGAIREVLADHSKLWTKAQLRDLAHKVAAARIDWRQGIDAERAAFYDDMQRIYTDNGQGDGRLALKVSERQNLFELLDSMISGPTGRSSAFSNIGIAMLTLPAANMVVASRKDMTDIYEEFTSHALEAIETPLWKQPASLLDDEVQTRLDEPLGKFRYLFVQLLLPAYDQLRNRIAALDGERDGVFIGLALELYHREHAKWPMSLDELSPQWLPALPVDRITGKPLQYRIVEDRPVVYSVGADGDDDSALSPADDSSVDPGSALPSPFEPQGTSYMFKKDGDWVIWSTAPNR